MNKTVLSFFIKTLNVESSSRYLKLLGYSFTKSEIEIILPYLKQNVHLLEKQNKDYLLKNLPSSISSYSKYQLSKLFDQYI